MFAHHLLGVKRSGICMIVMCSGMHTKKPGDAARIAQFNTIEISIQAANASINASNIRQLDLVPFAPGMAPRPKTAPAQIWR